MMKFSAGLVFAFGLSACTPAARDFEPNKVEKSTIDSLVTYEASEFEPNWFLKLTGGDTLDFTQLDPIAGNDLVTYRYAITKQTGASEGWTLQGSGEHGDITLTISKGQNCSHSGSGYLHRDTVDVKTATQNWRGCGGPILEGM